MGRTPLGLALGLLAVSWSCRDPRLEVVLDVPPLLKSSAAEIRLATLIPPANAPFACDDLAFQRVSSDVLRLSEASSIVLHAGEVSSPIENVDRLRARMFLAQVQNANGDTIAAACAELGEFDRDVSIHLAGEPVAHVGSTEAVDLSVVNGTGSPPRVSLPILDATGAPIPGVRVVWSTAGAAEAGSSGSATAGPDGVLDLLPSYPSRAGPFLLDLRIRWAQAPLVLSGFVAPPPKRAVLNGVPFQGIVGRLGPNGTPAAAVLLLRSTGEVIETYDARSFTEARGPVPLTSFVVPGSVTMGLLDMPGRPSDQLIAVGTSSASLVWIRFDPLGSLLRTRALVPPGAGKVLKVLRGGECGDSKSPEMLVLFEQGVLARYDPAGSLLSFETRTGDAANILEGGCISDQGGTAWRTLVHPTGIGGVVSLDLEAQGRKETTEVVAIQQTLAFSKNIGGAYTLIAAQLEFDDVVLSRVQLDAAGPQVHVKMFGSDLPPPYPYALSSGDIDGDHALDVVAMIADQLPAGQPRRNRIWASLAAEHEGARIQGAFRVPEEGLCFPLAITADFDGDGVDDLVIAEVPRALCGDLFGASQVFFYPMGR